MRFFLFTKTDWNDYPRLRHQLACLLADNGHEVFFFQLPNFPYQSSKKNISEYNGIFLYRYRQLIHHKLRFFPFIHKLNAAFEKKEIKTLSDKLDIKSCDVIVNFNYEYYFLRELFP